MRKMNNASIEKYRASESDLLNIKFTPLVSVIIPVYNVEKHLLRCLDSVIVQTYKNLEIILVDDGSQDNSGYICDKYREIDNRIIVVHQENQGQSAARNIGVKKSNGKYLCFVDSDDYVSKDYVQIMLGAALRYDAGIVQSKIKIVNNLAENDMKNSQCFSALVIEKGKYAPNDLRYKVAAVAKLYRSEIVRKTSFSDYTMNEDDASYYRFAYDANRICMIDYYTYYYYQSQNSVMRNDKNRKNEFIQIYKERVTFFEDKNEPELVLGSRDRFCLVLMLSYTNYVRNRTNKKDMPELYRIFKEQYGCLNEYELGIIRRCQYVLFYNFPDFTAKLIGLLHK